MSEEEKDGFTDIPQYEKPDFLQGEGTGIGEELEKVKMADLVDTTFAVMGYWKMASSYPESEFYMLIEIMDETGDRYKVSTSSRGLMQLIELRHSEGHIPFKTTLTLERTKKGRNAYSMT